MASLSVFICLLAACGAPPERQPNAVKDFVDNSANAVAPDGPEAMTPAQRRRAEARARRGDVTSMLALVQATRDPAGIRYWYAQAAAHGSCHAVRLLNGNFRDGVSARERRRWTDEDRRLGCSVHRWITAPGGSLHYLLPDESMWDLRIDCVAGTIEIAGPAGSTPHDEPQMIFNTSRGAQTRTIRRVSHEMSAMAFSARPDDEVVAALLRGETIGVGIAGGEFSPVDARGVVGPLRSLIGRCRGR